VASDFLGQTGSDATDIAVVGPDACKEPETPGGGRRIARRRRRRHRHDAARGAEGPSVSLVSPACHDRRSGHHPERRAGGRHRGRASVAKVDFFLGNRLICTVTTAPFTCKVLADGSEVGTQALRAVVTDSAGQTATAEASTKVAKFTPDALGLEAEALKVKSKGKPKLRRKLSGKLKLPARVTPAQGCASGTVAITVTRDGKTVLPSTQVASAPSAPTR